MTYSEKLKDPRWQKKRLEILNRDKFACQDCFETTKTLHVHHLDYEQGADPWDYPDNYLITLCEDCHETVTIERKEIEKKIISNFRIGAKTSFDQMCVGEVFENYKNLGNLFYLLWELKGEDADVEDSLRSLMASKRKNSFMSKAEITDMICPACGQKKVFEFKSLTICQVCGYEKVLISEEA
jgi:hypothetical protein